MRACVEGVLKASRVFAIRDPAELGRDSRLRRRISDGARLYSYILNDQSLLRQRFRHPIARVADCPVGDMLVSYVEEAFSTHVHIDHVNRDEFCFTTMLDGRMTMIDSGRETVAEGAAGVIHRGRPSVAFVTGDSNARMNLWLGAAKLEHSLELMLDGSLRQPLMFEAAVQWDKGLAASLLGQFGYLATELARPDGLASNPVAVASFSDLIVQTILQGLPHNHSALLGRDNGVAPAYLRRAEDYMRANAAKPVRMEQIAVAAGCSLRTLNAVFRQFRNTTPLAVLQAIRLDQVRAELRGAPPASTSEIARRHGFTNPSRFARAYARRFGETPANTTGWGPMALPEPIDTTEGTVRPLT